MRRVRRILRLGLALLLASTFAILTVALASEPCTRVTARFDIAVVLGAGMDADGTLHRSTIDRVAAGAGLINSGQVDRLHMTGGRAVSGGPAAGARMAALAREMGIAADRISHEDASLSTLQNALFSIPMLAPDARTILVTEGFHLARSWLSFRWAGRPVAGICHSTRFRADRTAPVYSATRLMVREVAAFWFNLGRATLWSVLHRLGRPRADIDPLLA